MAQAATEGADPLWEDFNFFTPVGSDISQSLASHPY